MKVLVTGGAGFVGSNLVDRLVELNHDVHVIDDLSSISSSTEYANSKAIYSYTSIDNIDAVYNGIEFDVIFHLAAHGRIQPSFDYPAEWFFNNAMGTVNVLDFARRNNCKSFVYATTSSKNHGSHLITPYTFSKVVGEDAVKMYAELYNMNTAMATFYNVYGLREPREGEFATVVAKFSRQYEDGDAITIVGDGQQSRDFTHVSDIVEGLIKISEGNWKGDNFDLGRGEPVKIIDLAMMITKGVASNITFTPLRKGEGMHTLCNVEETYNKLGWKAVKRLSDYIQTLTYTIDQ
jgi:UDP-glucose 4-epimerase